MTRLLILSLFVLAGCGGPSFNPGDKVVIEGRRMPLWAAASTPSDLDHYHRWVDSLRSGSTANIEIPDITRWRSSSWPLEAVVRGQRGRYVQIDAVMLGADDRPSEFTGVVDTGHVTIKPATSENLAAAKVAKEEAVARKAAQAKGS